MLINELIPAILTMFPDLNNHITIQQDNARPHIVPDDPDFLAAENINDLDYFSGY